MALAASLPASGAAQTVDEYRDRVARLRVLWDTATARADRAGRVREATTVLTLQAGSLLLLVAPHFERAARSAAPILAARLGEGLGADTALLRGLALYLPWGPESAPPVEGREVVRLQMLEDDRTRLVERLLRWTEGWLGRDSDTTFTRWLARSVPLGAGGPQAEEIYAELSVAPSPLAGACLAGDLHACRVGLVLEPVADSIGEWYDAEGRRNLVRSLVGLQRSDPAAARVCIERGWDQVCDDLLRRFVAGSVPPPISYVAREHLLRFALAQGGPGAYRRLYAAAAGGGPVDAILAATAQRDTRPLLADWQASIAASKPRAVALPGGVAVTSLLWIGVLLGLALASTRWR